MEMVTFVFSPLLTCQVEPQPVSNTTDMYLLNFCSINAAPYILMPVKSASLLSKAIPPNI